MSETGVNKFFAAIYLLVIVAGVATVIGACANKSGAAPTRISTVQSDCRAACTLEGMTLVGVELSVGGPNQNYPVTFTRCLCAPVTP